MRFLVVGFALFALFFIVQGYLAEALQLPEEFYNPLLIVRLMLAPVGWGSLPPDALMHTVYYIAAIAGLLSLVGWHTNLCLLLFTACMVLLQGFIYSFGEIHHREAVLMIALITLAFSPCGRYWSIDSLQSRGFNNVVDSPQSSSTHSEYAYWPIFVCKVFLALMYISAIASKFMESGLSWANGYTLQLYMAQDGLRWGSTLAVWLSQQHYFLMLGQIVVVVFQSTFWLVLFFPRLGWIYFPLGLFFHIMIFVTLKAPFWHWILLYFLFVPYSNIFKAMRGDIRYSDILSAA